MSSIVHRLQATARSAGRFIFPGAVVGRIVLYTTDGRRVLDLAVPPGDAIPEDTEDSGIPQPGWDFALPLPRFDGEEKPIYGRSLGVLKALAAADGPVKVDALRLTWGDYQPEEKTVRNQVAELRKLLEKLWPDREGDPITATGTGYRLEIR